MCKNCIFLSIKSLYYELGKLCSVFVHVCSVHMWYVSLLPILFLSFSSASPQTLLIHLNQSVRKKQTKPKI